MESNHGIFKALNGNVYGNVSSNQALVLVHGLGTAQSVWQNIIPFLAYFFHFKIIVFDLAFSPNVSPPMYEPEKYSKYSGYATDLVNVLDELKVDQVIYMGHSMGAMIGCIAAVRRPRLFRHLILLTPNPRYLNDGGYYGGFSKHEVEMIFKHISQNYTDWVQTFARKAIGVNDRIAISAYENSLMKMNPNITLSVAKAAFLSDWRPLLPKVHVPTTIIHVKKDFAVPDKVAYFTKKRLGGHPKLIILRTQGHFPQLTAPVVLLKVLGTIISKI
ncbi:strigolactone esterase D14-like [Silene latifolia]|uniref:strigolactone esterase D14-like n=1 Tax=Silene latifolia TaxID=37657 RepID=UPI003D771EB6